MTAHQGHRVRPSLSPGQAGARGRQSARLRLRTAQGHLEAVLRMMDDDRYCIDILHQLSAVEATITRARKDILDGHLRGCVPDAIADGTVGPEGIADEVLAAVFGGSAPAPRDETRAIP